MREISTNQDCGGSGSETAAFRRLFHQDRDVQLYVYEFPQIPVNHPFCRHLPNK